MIISIRTRQWKNGNYIFNMLKEIYCSRELLVPGKMPFKDVGELFHLHAHILKQPLKLATWKTVFFFLSLIVSVWYLGMAFSYYADITTVIHQKNTGILGGKNMMELSKWKKWNKKLLQYKYISELRKEKYKLLEISEKNSLVHLNTKYGSKKMHI